MKLVIVKGGGEVILLRPSLVQTVLLIIKVHIRSEPEEEIYKVNTFPFFNLLVASLHILPCSNSGNNESLAAN
jgi:hypothetical protein